jgi:hypothetical protein
MSNEKNEGIRVGDLVPRRVSSAKGTFSFAFKERKYLLFFSLYANM